MAVPIHTIAKQADWVQVFMNLTLLFWPVHKSDQLRDSGSGEVVLPADPILLTWGSNESLLLSYDKWGLLSRCLEEFKKSNYEETFRRRSPDAQFHEAMYGLPSSLRAHSSGVRARIMKATGPFTLTLY